MESFNAPAPEQENGESKIEVSPMEGFKKYEMGAYWQEQDRIDARIDAIKKGEAKTREGTVVSGTDAVDEITRLENMGTQFKEAAIKGTISDELLEQRNSW